MSRCLNLIRSVIVLWLITVVCGVADAGEPAWWYDRDVIDAEGQYGADYAPLLAGHLKWAATNACDEMETEMPAGAGSDVWNMVRGFGNVSNGIVVNLGQLKNVAEPFYEKLIEKRYVEEIPWTQTTDDDADLAPANLGQLKAVFNFEVADDDNDGLPDAWEMRWFGDTNSYSGTGDPDGDSCTNYAEFIYGLCPTNAETATGDEDDDGYPNIYETQHGTHCRSADDIPAPTIIVTNGGVATIQDAIDTCSSAYDIVLIQSGTYTNAGDMDLDFGGKKILVTSEGETEDCIIDCGRSGRGFSFENSETIESVVSRLTVANGYTTNNGGGIFITNSSPTILSCIIRDCESFDPTTNYFEGDGGGIYCSYSDADIVGCEVLRNQSRCDGGGIFCQRSTVTIESCNVVSNSGWEKGGGIRIDYGPATNMIRNCMISGNMADFDGGGISMQECWGDLDVEACRIIANVCNDCGGGNSGGGGVMLRGTDLRTELRNCLVAGNTTDWKGGGISIKGQKGSPGPMVLNCTIADNEAGTAAGGVYVFGTNVDEIAFGNILIWGNSGAQVVEDVPDTSPIFSYCDIQGWTNGGELNITNDPCMSPVTYRLHTNSPCIGAGFDLTPFYGLTNDCDKELRSNPPDIGWDEAEFVSSRGMASVWMREYLDGTHYEDDSDQDSDGLTNVEEFERGTDPLNSDSDGDELTDGAEVNTHGTDPTTDDTEQDGMPDGWEVDNNLDPSVNDAHGDADGDGMSNACEHISFTDPNDSADPSTNDIVQIEIVLGDYSGSDSEWYKLNVIGSSYWTCAASVPGEVTTTTVSFVKGNAYTMALEHGSGDGDYDHVLTFDGMGLREIGNLSLEYNATNYIYGDEWAIADPNKVTGTTGNTGGQPDDTKPFLAKGKEMVLYIPKIDINGDYNRDGNPADDHAEADAVTFGGPKGFVVLPNNDDDNGDGEPDCNQVGSPTPQYRIDGTDDIADVYELHVARFGIPSNAIPPGMTIEIKVLNPTNETSTQDAIIYHERHESTIGGTTLSFEGDAAVPSFFGGEGSIVMGIEGLKHGEEVRVRMIVELNDIMLGTDEIRVLVAPWLALSNDRRATTVHSGFGDDTAFVADMDDLFGSGNMIWEDYPVWRQDEGEFGYTRTGVGQTTYASRSVIMDLKSTSDDYKNLISSSKGWDDSIRSSALESQGGGIEVSIPDTNYPYGRLIMSAEYDGATGSEFLELQKLQWPPIFLPVDWLLVGHVDEVMSIVPAVASNAICVGDLTNAIAILNDYTTYPTNEVESGDYFSRSYLVGVYTNPANATAITTIQGFLDSAAATLSTELGVTIIRIPVAYTLEYTGAGNCKTFLPNSVNAAIANIGGTIKLGAPDPRFGPFRQVITNRLSAIGANPTWINCDTPHGAFGEAHCASNADKESPSSP